MQIVNTASGKKTKLARLVQMHADSMEDVQVAKSGEICALFGIDCSSGDTFTDATLKNFSPTMMTMFVPDPVVSLAVKPAKPSEAGDKFSKAINRFMREDPTFRVAFDDESKETIISGMGELHLEVYLERMKREYGVETVSGSRASTTARRSRSGRRLSTCTRSRREVLGSTVKSSATLNRWIAVRQPRLMTTAMPMVLQRLSL